jgi:hypothetical protein
LSDVPSERSSLSMIVQAWIDTWKDKPNLTRSEAILALASMEEITNAYISSKDPRNEKIKSKVIRANVC